MQTTAANIAFAKCDARHRNFGNSNVASLVWGWTVY